MSLPSEETRRPMGFPEWSARRRLGSERFIDRRAHGFVLVRLPEHASAVDDNREPLSDLVTESDPGSPRGVQANDLDADAISEIAEEILREPVGAVRILEDEGRRVAKLLRPQRFDRRVCERLGAGGSARLEDRRQEPDELNSWGSRGHVYRRAAGR